MNNLKDIPNRPGFKFVGITKTGEKRVQEVKKGPKGTFYTDNYLNLKAWEPLPRVQQ
jgi:hypothetical protein